MSLQFVRRWIEGIPPAERDLPLVPFEGKVYTPNQVLRLVESGSPVGEEIQKRLEARKFTTKEELERIAKMRLLSIIRSLPPGMGLGTFSGKVYTKEELEKLVEEGKGIGKYLIEQEIRIIKRRLGI